MNLLFINFVKKYNHWNKKMKDQAQNNDDNKISNENISDDEDKTIPSSSDYLENKNSITATEEGKSKRAKQKSI